MLGTYRCHFVVASFILAVPLIWPTICNSVEPMQHSGKCWYIIKRWLFVFYTLQFWCHVQRIYLHHSCPVLLRQQSCSAMLDSPCFRLVTTCSSTELLYCSCLHFDQLESMGSSHVEMALNLSIVDNWLFLVWNALTYKKFPVLWVRNSKTLWLSATVPQL